MPTPVTDNVFTFAAISDDDSMDSLVCKHSESKEEFRDDDYGFIHIPQPLLALKIVNEGAGLSIIPDV